MQRIRHIRNIVLGGLLVLAVGACTPQQMALWDEINSFEPGYTERVVRKLQATRAAEPPRGVWDSLAQCESGGNWSINTGNGYYGGLQFSLQSWHWVGGTGYPHHHTRAEQIHRGELLKARQGWGAWPACSRKLGLR